MKILWISHLVPYPPKAGVILRSYNLVRQLSRRHEVDLLAISQKGLIAPYFDSFEGGLTRCYDELSTFCGDVEFFPCNIDKNPGGRYWCALKSLFSTFPYSVNWLWSESLKNKLLYSIRNKSYDVIHFDTVGMMSYFFEEMKASVVSLNHHNIESHMLFRRIEKERNYLKKAYYFQEAKRVESLEKKYCKLVTTNLTCSDLDSARLAELVNSDNVKVIPNGVDTQYFYPLEVSNASNKLIFIGTLDWYPNIRAVRFLAYKLWHVIKREVPEISIEVIGANPPADVVKFSQSNPGFEVRGFVDDIRPHMQSAAIYVCPINDGGGTKLKLLDAFSSGKAVIADPIACEGLNITDGKNVLLASTITEYVDKIKYLLANREMIKYIGENARSHVENHFSFDSIGESLSQHFEQLVESKRADENNVWDSRLGSV